jgi:hypothetical protein
MNLQIGRLTRVVDVLVIAMLLSINYGAMSAIVPSTSPLIPVLVVLCLFMTFLELYVCEYVMLRLAERKLLKSLGMKSMAEVIKKSAQMTKYMQDVASLSDPAKLEIAEKIKEFTIRIENCKKEPDWYFTHKNTTREGMLKQIEDEFNKWMKEKGYPVPEGAQI